MEGKSHEDLKSLIGKFLREQGFRVKLEFRLGTHTYDIVIWDKNKNRFFIEVYSYPPRLNPKSLKPNIVCNHCAYFWHTESKIKMPTCPSCKRQVKRYRKVI